MSPLVHGGVATRRRATWGQYAREFVSGDRVNLSRGGNVGTEPLTMAAVVWFDGTLTTTLQSFTEVMGISADTAFERSRIMRILTASARVVYWDQSFGGTEAVIVPATTWLTIVAYKGTDGISDIHVGRHDTGAWTHAVDLAKISRGVAAGGYWVLGNGRPSGAYASPQPTQRMAGAAAWNGRLTSSQVRSLMSSGRVAKQSVWATVAGGPAHLWSLNQTSTSTAVKDVIGTADQVGLVGSTVVNMPNGVPWVA